MTGRTHARWLIVAALAAAFVGGCRGTGDVPATGIPDEDLAKLTRLHERGPLPPGPPAQVERIYRQRLGELLTLGHRLDREHPEASNRDELYELMLAAAGYLYRYEPNEQTKKQLRDVTGRILAAHGDIGLRANADAAATDLAIRDGADAEKEIHAYAQRYAHTAVEGEAIISAASLAKSANLGDLADTFLQEAETKHLHNDNVYRFLLLIRRIPLTATLPTLEGPKLQLPHDLKGKVVVLDFWAMWCPPCVQAMPHMKQLYSEYQPQGLEIVGIDLDPAEDEAKLRKFIADRQLNWIHVFSGKFTEDPLALRLNVQAAPSVWVFGRDGKLITNNAMLGPNGYDVTNIDGVVEAALQAPAPKSDDATK